MESDFSAKEDSQFDTREEKFLNKKRSIKYMKENYLFRRVLTGKTQGKYENTANVYYNMMAFNWDDERILKNRAHILNNLNSSSFWFYIASMYFPKCGIDILDKGEHIPDIINRILDRIISHKKNLKKKSFTNTKNRFLCDIRSFFEEGNEENKENQDISKTEDDHNSHMENTGLKLRKIEENGEVKQEKSAQNDKNVISANLYNLSLDSVIVKLESDLSLLKSSNKKTYNHIVRQLLSEYSEISSRDIPSDCAYDSDDILSDSKFYSLTSAKFQKYLIKKHEDSASNNPSNCILSRAEEETINSNPDDIVCVVCNDGDYEDNDLIVYCSSCQITVHQSCYGIVVLPKEDWICLPCLSFGNSKEIDCLLCPVKGGAMKPCHSKKKLLLDDALTISSNSTENNPSEGKGKRGRKKKIEITSKYSYDQSWVHISCALWTPEVIIEDYAKKEIIKRPTVKCENERCSLRFHVECARINKYQLEMVNNSQGDIKFYIYCQTHRPHKLIKNIELRKTRAIDDIELFQKILEKNYEILSKVDKRLDFSVFVNRKSSLDKKPDSKFEVKLSKKMKAKLISSIRETCRNISNMNILLKNNQINTTKEKILLNYFDTLNPSIFPWYLFKGFCGLSAIDVYKIYRNELVTNEFVFSNLILKKTISLKKKTLAAKLKKKKIKIVEQDLYCYCRKPFLPGEYMISCKYECDETKKCANNGWVHSDCVEELRTLPKEVIEDENFVFVCKECKAKYE